MRQRVAAAPQRGRPGRGTCIARLLQAVGLSVVLLILVALYMRHESATAVHLLASARHRAALMGDEQLGSAKAEPGAQKAPNQPGAPVHLQARAAAALASPPPPATATATATASNSSSSAIPEPFGSHHMYDHPGPYQPCPAPGSWPPGTWVSEPAAMGRWALPYTLEAQHEIHAHQHPASCEGAKFIVHSVFPNGIGGAIHVTGVALMIALDTGRIFVEAPGTFLAPGDTCGPNATTMDSCYFLPYSHCRPSEEQMRKAVNIMSARDSSADPAQGMKLKSDADVVVTDHAALVAVRAYAPQRFLARLAATPLQKHKHYYWWRAQAAAYMLRPRPNVLEELRAREKRSLAGPAPGPGCISVHVRHGDKGIEAEVFNNEKYESVAAQVLALDPARLTNKLFVSTEDPDTIEYFVNKTAGRWGTGYTAGVPRKPDRSRPNLSYMMEIGYREEMLNSLLNLDLALRCWGFAGSIYSNWVRLIDELRSTLRCKADAVFADTRYTNPHEMDTNW